MNFFDQFDTTPDDLAVQPGAPAVEPPPTVAPENDKNFFDQFEEKNYFDRFDAAPAVTPPQPAPTASVVAGATGEVQPEAAFTTGLQGGLFGANPKMFGSAAEGIGILADAPWLQEKGKEIAGYGTAQLEQYKARVPSFTNIRTDSFQGFVEDLGSYAGYQAGSGLGTSLPTLGTGLVAGAVTSNPIVGVIAGAAGPSFIQNYGDVYSSAKEDAGIKARVERGELTPKQLAGLTALAAVPVAALDVVGLSTVLGGTVFAQAKRDLIGRITRGIGTGAIAEGTTEALQETVSQWSQHWLGSETPLKDKLIKVVDNALGGLFGGGLMGGATGVIPQRPAPVTPPAASVPVETTRVPDLDAPQMRAPMASASAEAPVFYSQLLRTAEEKLPASASPEQIIATLRNAPGVKGEEIEWTGIADWLAQQAGPVSKRDVVAELEANQVQVQEKLFYNDTASPEGETRNWTNYQAYAVPGPKANYRELLLTLPSTKPTAFSDQERAAFVQQYRKEYGSDPSEGAIIGHFQKQKGTPDYSKDYRGPHWSEPNVLAHVRFSERTDASGTPMLFMDEMQSDWHQTGRREGYKGQTQNRRYEARQGFSDDPAKWGVWDTRNEKWSYGVSHQLAAIEEAGKLNKMDVGVPNAPFKSSWHELAFKRMLRWAADNGYSRLAWTNGAAISRVVAGGDTTITRGNVEFYDRILPSLARKYAKRLGGSTGTSRFVEAVWKEDGTPLSQDLAHYIDIPPRAMSVIRSGLPLFSRQATGQRWGVELDPTLAPRADAKFVTDARRVVDIVQKIQRQFDIRVPVRYRLHEAPSRVAGWLRPQVDGSYIIDINLNQNPTSDILYATMMHEFGHLVMYEKFTKLPTREQLAIREAYNRFRRETTPAQRLGTLWKRRDNAVVNYYNSRDAGGGQLPLYSLNPEQREYWSGFDEWFAEQVAKWATSSERPLSLVDKTFKSLGRVLKAIFERASQLWGNQFRATPEMAQWLDSFIDTAPPFAHETFPVLDERTRRDNASALADVAPEVEAPERQLETQSGRDMMSAAFDGKVPPEGKQMAAFADKYNKFYKYMLDILQLAELNPRFTPLLRYVEKIRAMHIEEQKINDAALRVAKAWRGLGDQGENLTALIDDVTNMVYRTNEEVARGVARHPRPEEFQRLVAKHKVSPEAVVVFDQIRRSFDAALVLAEQNAITDALKMRNLGLQAKAIQDIRARTANLRAKPYFPFVRFGRHTVTVRDATGVVVGFYTTERRGFNSAETLQNQLAAELERKKEPGWTIHKGVLADDAMPFLGMPSHLLERMAQKMELSTSQRDALEQLTFELSPAQSFKHRFQHKNYVKGYSSDFKRAYAKYFFHFGKYYAKTKYIDGLRDDIKLAREVEGVKAQDIGNRMSRHLKDTIIDPKSDWAFGKALIFFWAMGYVPASAALNLNQIIVANTFLSAKFGAVKTQRAMVAAMTDLTTFYKRGKYDKATDFELRALSYGIKTGRITEAMAPELAGMSQGRNLGTGIGGNKIERAFQGFMEKAAWMFEMAEQTNRRITYRAALKLAYENPTNPYVQDTLNRYQDEYKTLVARGDFTEAEARAVITAAHGTEQTQFNYAPYARAIAMQGKVKGTVFVFKKYMQSMLFLMFNNKADFLPRYFLVAGFMGGLMGLPGADDLKEAIKAVGFSIFGKDWDVEREAKRYMKQLLSMTGYQSDVGPDMVLHGMARRGFGIPAALDMMGNTVGIGNVPFPVLDRSKALSMGNILPVKVGALFGPAVANDPNRVIADEVARGGGAFVGTAFSIFKALTDNKLDAGDPKRWERAVPRALGNASRAFRAFTEGRERSRSGGPNSAGTIISFDPRDPEQMMEMLAMAAGYQPLRLAEKWDQIRNTIEVTQFYDLQRQGLLKQMFEAVAGKNKEEIARVTEAIKQWNGTLPDFAKPKAITGETITRSMETRFRTKNAQDIGVPVQKSNIGIAKEMQRLFPQTVIEQRPVR